MRAVLAMLVGYRRMEKRYTTDHGQFPDVLDIQGCVLALARPRIRHGDSPKRCGALARP
ncbi:hypothetical protein OG243_07100 [Streptomyces sp. NBC_01318]|uniref:hypothetical protein n=1 Tax=Streptomyces sp. NBC_01318 TaxID=2903823 RepID=UPI002E0D9A8F|nr:hypothetical protein OG243_07100 [Streptomyces sp. NBC_01318]